MRHLDMMRIQSLWHQMIISTSNKLYDANNKCLYNSGKGGVWVTWKYVKKNQQRVGIYPISGIMPVAECLQFCDMIFLMCMIKVSTTAFMLQQIDYHKECRFFGGNHWDPTRIILCMRLANERRCYTTPSLTGWTFTQNDHCSYIGCLKFSQVTAVHLKIGDP